MSHPHNPDSSAEDVNHDLVNLVAAQLERGNEEATVIFRKIDVAGSERTIASFNLEVVNRIRQTMEKKLAITKADRREEIQLFYRIRR